MSGMFRNIGGRLEGDSIVALLPATITAGAGNDGQEVDGVIWDRLKTGREGSLSGALFIFGRATLTDAATLTAAFNVQDGAASNLSDAADYGSAFASAVVATGPTGGGTVDFCVKLDVDLSSAKRYGRAQVTLNLSASGTDTVAAAGLLVLAPAEKLPG